MNCEYCKIIKCPILNKDQCVANLLRKRIAEMEKQAEMEGIHIVNQDKISVN